MSSTYCYKIIRHVDMTSSCSSSNSVMTSSLQTLCCVIVSCELSPFESPIEIALIMYDSVHVWVDVCRQCYMSSETARHNSDRLYIWPIIFTYLLYSLQCWFDIVTQALYYIIFLVCEITFYLHGGEAVEWMLGLHPALFVFEIEDKHSKDFTEVLPLDAENPATLQ